MAKRDAVDGETEMLSPGFRLLVTTDSGVDVNIIPNWRLRSGGWGPAQNMPLLHHAARAHQWEAVVQLVRLGADVEAVDFFRERAVPDRLPPGSTQPSLQYLREVSMQVRMLALCTAFEGKLGRGSPSALLSMPTDLLRIVANMLLVV